MLQLPACVLFSPHLWTSAWSTSALSTSAWSTKWPARQTLPCVVALLCLLLTTAANAVSEQVTVTPATHDTKFVNIPLKLSPEFLRRALTEAVFPNEAEQVTVWTDGVGCNFLKLNDPQLSVVRQMIRLQAPGVARVGRELSESSCIVAMDWNGISQLDLRTVLSDDGRTIRFKVADSQLLNHNRKASLRRRAVWSLVKHHVHPRIEQLQIDLTPTVEELRGVLSLFLFNDNPQALDPLLDSIRLIDLAVSNDGIKTTLQLESPLIDDTLGTDDNNDELAVDLTADEPVLSDTELQHWHEQSQAFDVFITAIIKSLAGSTQTPALKTALLDILIDTRYAIDEALTLSDASAPDPVRVLFVRVWQRLVPLMAQIAEEQNNNTSLRFLAFIAAGDALTALDELGPATGLEISTPGLRRLARVLISDDTALPQDGVPSNALDEDLRERLLMGPVPRLSTPQETLGWQRGFDWLIAPAIANTKDNKNADDVLDQWAPSARDAADYLPLVSALLDATVERTLNNKPLESTFVEVFPPLVLATAWQESCWRQWVNESGKTVPIRSSVGAVGLMQVRPRVWRGFYDPQLLTQDIRYNAIAGAEILHLYLTRYAIPHKLYTLDGGLNNLARATYAAYNGGPRHLERYLNADTKESLKRIDASFLGKYQTMYQGNTDAVLRCFGLALK